MRGVGGLVVAAIAGLLVSCSDPPQESSSDVSFAATLTQYRNYEGTRKLSVGITNSGDAPVTVTSVTIDWPGFAPEASRPDTPDLAPDDVSGVSMVYGDPDCGAQTEDEPVLAVTADGSEYEVALEAEDWELLRGLYERECAQERLAATVSVTLALEDEPTRVGDDEFLAGEVVLDPQTQDGPPVTLVDLGGSVLVDLVPARGAPQLPVRASAQDVTRFPVLVGSAGRCDPHARGGSSQTFLLGAYVRVGQQPTQRVILIPDKAHQVEVLAIIDRDCT